MNPNTNKPVPSVGELLWSELNFLGWTLMAKLGIYFAAAVETVCMLVAIFATAHLTNFVAGPWLIAAMSAGGLAISQAMLVAIPVIMAILGLPIIFWKMYMDASITFAHTMYPMLMKPPASKKISEETIE
jgi:hypothetical protein